MEPTNGFDKDSEALEADLSVADLCRYGIAAVWAAFHDFTLRPALFRKWRQSWKAFPSWVDREVYAQRHAKHSASKTWAVYAEWQRVETSELSPRQSWQELYADELSANPAFAFALASSVGQVFRQAKLSEGEAATMKALCEGKTTWEIGELRGVDYHAIKVEQRRAIAKLRHLYTSDSL